MPASRQARREKSAGVAARVVQPFGPAPEGVRLGVVRNPATRWSLCGLSTAFSVSGRERFEPLLVHQAVELGVGDQVGSLLVAQRTAEHARQANEALASAGQAVWLVAGRDQFTLNAEAGGLQWDKIDVPESRAVNTLAKHDC